MIVFEGEKGDITSLAFEPNGKLLVASNAATGLEMWDVLARRKWGRFTGIAFHNAPAAFHPTEAKCFALVSQGIAVIDTVAETVRVLSMPSVLEWLGLLAIEPDGNSCVGQVRGTTDYDLRRYRIEPGAQRPLQRLWASPLERLTTRSPAPLDLPTLHVSPDGKTLATLIGERDRYTWIPKPLRVSLRSVTSGEVLRSAKLPAGTIGAFAFTPDSKSFATCRTHVLSIWNADDLTTKPRGVRSDTRSHFTALAFHPSGRYLAATSKDGTVKFYDTTTWGIAHSFTWGIGKLRSIAFSPDGMLAAAGGDKGKVVVWDVDL